MLHFQDDEIEVVPASDDKLHCVECVIRLASWKAKRFGEDEMVPYCGWCLLYGNSQWGRDNAEEAAYVGEFVRHTALQNLTARTHVPELDARHRLNWRDAERYIMGVVFTSRTLKVSFAHVARIRARIEEMDGVDEGADHQAQGDVPNAAGRREGEAQERQGAGGSPGAEGPGRDQADAGS